METSFRKTEAKFKFSKDWIDIAEKTQSVTVDLIINYNNKTFSITPNNQVAGKFAFCQGGSNAVIMWNSILEVMKEANQFANKELEF